MKVTLMSGGSSSWRTPHYVLDLVRSVGPVLYDPASDDSNPTDAGVYSTPCGTYLAGGDPVSDLDGLHWTWPEDGLVFVNPPYGRALDPWSRKIAAYEGEAIALVPARVSTRWYRRLHAWADWGIHWSSPQLGSRLRFEHPEGISAHAAAFPSTLFYRGINAGRFIEVLSPHGTLFPCKSTLRRLLAAGAQTQ